MVWNHLILLSLNNKYQDHQPSAITQSNPIFKPSLHKYDPQDPFLGKRTERVEDLRRMEEPEYRGR